ncbi:MAG: hypothetical protein ACLTFJ_11550 [Clostridium sp.]
MNRKYFSNLRIEKLDAETGEPILHDDAVFGVYRAERNEADDGDGAVRCYTADTMILGSQHFLEAMGAKEIRTFARKAAGAGELFYGTVPAGTPICQESDLVSFTDKNGLQTGTLMAIPTIRDIEEKGILQAVGYAKTPNPLPAGGYVLAEVKPPAGYVRSGPVAVEIYSDRILYSGGWTEGKTAAAVWVRAGSDGIPGKCHGYCQNSGKYRKILKIQAKDSELNSWNESIRASGRNDIGLCTVQA